MDSKRRKVVNRDFDSAAWAQGHHHLSDGIARLIQKAAYGFERLSAIQYDAPWKRARR
jgi:hypothetical protein